MLRTDRRDDGFTLIELMVVVLVIAILLAIAIPTYLGARQRANDRVAMSNARTAFSAARVFYTEAQQYTADTAKLAAIEPSLAWTNTPLDSGAGTSAIYVETADVPWAQQTVIVAARSKSGKCFFLRDVMNDVNAGTYYEARVPSGATCDAPAPADPVWAAKWGG